MTILENTLHNIFDKNANVFKKESRLAAVASVMLHKPAKINLN